METLDRAVITEELVMHLRLLRADGKLQVSDAHVRLLRDSRMTWHDVETRSVKVVEGALVRQGIPHSVAESIVFELRLVALGPGAAYSNAT
jgi:hypothetical protein